MTEPRRLRVTIGENARAIGPDEVATLGVSVAAIGPGSAILQTRDGLRRLAWTALTPLPGANGQESIDLEIILDGWRFVATVELADRAELREKARRGATDTRHHRALILRAPIPGRIGSVRVAEGQPVDEGETLLTLEAMKMENLVRAPRAGTIGRVEVGAGQTVELGDTLLELV